MDIALTTIISGKVTVPSPPVTTTRGGRLSKVITVTDDGTGTTTRIEVDGQGVRRLVIESDTESGLPDDMLSALLPYIGLPAVRPGGKPIPADANGTPDPGEPTRMNRSAPGAAFLAPVGDARETGERKAATVTTLAPRPAIEPASSPPAPAPRPEPVRRRAKHRPAPADAELSKVISEIGAVPKDLAEHYGVPNSIISNWLYGWRKRQKALRGEPN